PCPEFVRSLKAINECIEIIPAHIWTPWFSLFGSKSGFDSLNECFQDQTDKISAIETGLSSNPEMNWQVSQLDNMQILSFSDSHSHWPWRIGREATIFEIEPDYKSLLRAIQTGEGLAATIEVDPNYGKYHYDGHRNCQIMFSPEESKKHNNICPICKKTLTIGVMYRAKELSDRQGTKSTAAKPYYTLVPLAELISAQLKSAVASNKVTEEYYRILKQNNEFEVMLELPKEELLKRTGEQMVELILKNREGNLFVKPGYDGVYGELVLDMEKSEDKVESKIAQSRPLQTGLNEFFTQAK
ncbi:MAG: endonuclease Q family protein, partial [Candidatus Woesearchaeota archaeon]